MNGIRKTALLLSGLEWQTVDLLLGRLDSESAKAIRREMMSLKPVSVRETDRLANEFLHKAGRPPRSPRQPRQPSTLIEHQLPQSPERPTYTPTYTPPNRLNHAVCFGAEAFVPPNRPFDFLRDVETDEVVREIADEHPQTVAVVLAHLPASRAGKILGCLPPTLQKEVTKRLAGFEETDKQILHEIELSLRERLERRRYSDTRQTQSNAVLNKIVEASRTQETLRQDTLHQDTLHQDTLRRLCNSRELPERSYTFDDLERLGSREIEAVFRSVDTATVLTALIGAKPPLIERVMKHFSPTEEYQMRQQLKRLGTINENDVIRARNILLDKAEPMMR
ncbi:MAG: hypothetical protein LBU34_06360 [Planctomycetaceae bacterium]|jgi:flagellar motor switch protein FliG|nr:hypothetical protein [Planctomycetaceae bacterium]